jgi:5'-nucleotidase
LLTQAFSNGTAYSDISITLDPRNGDIVSKTAAIMTTWADQGIGLKPDPDVAALVNEANIAVKPMVNRVVGVAASDILRTENAAGESTLGDLIADSTLHAMEIEMAFTSSSAGGIRADIDAGEITWGELFAVKPFSNTIIAMTLTGEQIQRVLMQQWQGRDRGFFMQISGFTYRWDASRPGDDKIIEIHDANGQLIDPERLYRVATSNFFATGGNNFTVFKEGTDRVVGPLLLDALENYIQTLPQPLVVELDGRIQRIN